MSSPSVLTLPGVDFGVVRAQVRHFMWHPHVRVVEIASPQRIAPYSLAIEAELTDRGEELASGRLILLHDPDGNEAWQGTYRCVSLAEAAVEADLASDPLLTEVGWSWLTDALNRSDCDYTAESGTVTTINGRSFGGLACEPDRTDIEIRASWTPVFTGPVDIRPHLAAWQDLLCLTGGLAPLPDGMRAHGAQFDWTRPT
ncbi:MAG: DUF3000 domain-containing protein [Actinomycetia bacterium]|nr:DUF3000 domain-containing protein [Actinomycetes bacterium]